MGPTDGETEPARSRLLCATWTKFAPESGLADLPQTAVGAQALADHLTASGALADLPTIMVDASGITCLNAIEDLIARSRAGTDNLIIYLASHGLTPTTSQQLYRLATGDTRRTDDLLRSIPVGEIIDRLKDSTAGLNWLIVDACFAGHAGDALMGSAEAKPRALPNTSSLCLLASSDPFSSSLAPLGQDLTAFTQLLIDALQAGDPTAGSYRSIVSIYEAVRAASEERGYPSPFLLAQGVTAETPFLSNASLAPVAVSESGQVQELTRYDNCAEILFVDDIEYERSTFKKELEDVGHRVTVVSTPAEAHDRVQTTFYDIIVVDLFLKGDQPASELIAYLSQAARESMLLVASRASKGWQPESWTKLSGLFQYPHNIAAFLFKPGHINKAKSFANKIRERRSFTLSHVIGLEPWIPLVSGRMTRRSAVSSALSSDLEVQIRICVERVVSRWFDLDSNVTDYIHNMYVDPIDSGRSSCTVFSLTPSVQGVRPVTVNPLLLKIGPRAEIAEEVNRYEKFVQIGVPLELRTDKIGSAEIGAVGAVIYSFLGETAGSIVEVGELGPDGIADCLTRVFDPTRKRWLASSGTGDDIELQSYFEERGYDTSRFLRVAQVMQNSLKKTRASIEEVDVGFCEHARMGVAQRTTLVHGDLHLGNLLKYGPDGRYAMIDYRNVGIGPRLMDFVTLEIACWLLAKAPEAPMSQLMTHAHEVVVSGGLWHDPTSADVAPWLRDSLRLARHCRDLARQNFGDITAAEYGSLLWMSAVRRFEFQATATTAEEKRTLKILPIALTLAAQKLVVS